MASPKRPQHTWYVGAIAHRNPPHRLTKPVTGSPTRSGNARLRAFSSGYRVLPIPNRHGQSPKSSKSAAPATAVARRVGALPVPKGHTGSTCSLSARLPYRVTASCGRLRRSRETPLAQCWSKEKKLPERPLPPTGLGDRRTSDVFSELPKAKPASHAPSPPTIGELRKNIKGLPAQKHARTRIPSSNTSTSCPRLGPTSCLMISCLKFQSKSFQLPPRNGRDKTVSLIAQLWSWLGMTHVSVILR
jgi:hypothetical protein